MEENKSSEKSEKFLEESEMNSLSQNLTSTPKSFDEDRLIGKAILLSGLFFLALIGFILLVSALTDDEKMVLQNEMSSLEQNLTAQGYGWLINYSVDYNPINDSAIEVYRQDGGEVIARFENITGENWYKVYLTGLGNESEDVFDLRVLGNVEFDYIVDPSNGSTNIPNYTNVSDVYHDFVWERSNIKMQVRSCDDAVCDVENFTGPDGTSETWYNNLSFNRLNISNNKYFQYIAYLFRNVTVDGRVNDSFTPLLQNVSIGYYNSSVPYVTIPVIDSFSNPYSEFNCSTWVYSMGSAVNVTFNWYADNSVMPYKTENVTSASGQISSSTLNLSEILTSKLWNCSVYAYDGNYSTARDAVREVGYEYYSVYSIFDAFVWYGDNIKMQVRSCDDAVCDVENFTGEDNTSSSFFNLSTSGNLTNITSNRYFQYMAYLFRNKLGSEVSPRLSNVSINSDTGATHVWNCTIPYKWENVSCWSLGRVPVAGENIIINGSAVVDDGIIIDARNLIINGNGSIANYTTSVSNHGASLLINLTGNLTILSGGNISGGNISIIAANVNVSLGGIIYTSGLGYNSSQGTGKGIKATSCWPGSGSSGAGYGGIGGDCTKDRSLKGGSSYGSYSNPVDFGSGGGDVAYGGAGGAGGGIIKINITAELYIQGSILATGKNTSGGGGSGGSIWLIANNITGIGNISANGGNGGSDADCYGRGSGGGAGGRIAIYSTNNTFTGNISAGGGAGASYNSAAGTIFKKLPSQTYGDLIINNNNIVAGDRNDIGARLGAGIHTFDNITIRNKGNLEIPNSSVELNLTNTNVIGDGDPDSRITITGNVTITNNYTIGNWTLALNNGSIINNLWNLTIGTGGILSHTRNYNATRYILDLSLNKLTVGFGGSVNVTGGGYIFENGPGAGVYVTTGGGGGYGGRGGDANVGTGGIIYGSYLEPILLGSGGGYYSGGSGGGAIKINASLIEIQGQIISGGNKGTTYGGGGSGGSIWLIANNITGIGNISANGGNGGGNAGGGGAGGRIHIQARNLSLSGNISNLGGTTFQKGNNGTIVLEFSENINVASATFLSPFNIARNNSYGRIVYSLENNATNQTINRSVPFQSGLTFYNRSLIINATEYPDLNKSAQIRFFNVFLTGSYRLLRDGSLCLGSICTNISYTGSIFSFNITQGSNYTLAESTICDEGTLADTCIVNSTRFLDDNSTILGQGNLTIGTNGSIANYTTSIANHGASLSIVLGGDLLILNNGNISFGNISIIAANVNVSLGGKIETSGLGYNSSQGPGTGVGGGMGTGSGGAGYGGGGGFGSTTGKSGGSAYGSYSNPIDFGSRGGAGYVAGIGGGIIKINATGNLSIEGQILTNGGTGYGGVNYGDGGGSGGSIWLIANNITGTGNISAKGGAGGDGSPDGGGGAGGRIAIYVTNNTFTGNITSYGGGGPEGGERAAPGTIYKKLTSQTYGDLIIDNNNSVAGQMGSGAKIKDIGARLGAGVHTFDNLTIRNKGNLEIENSSVELNLTNTNVIGDGQPDSRITITGNVTITNNYTINNWTLALNNGSTINNLWNLTIGGGGILSHAGNYNISRYKLDLSLNKLTILSGGSVNVSKSGYSATFGPGNGTNGGNDVGSGGAGYGGRGGNGETGVGGGISYGSYLEPIELGSGGGNLAPTVAKSHGGGAVKINASIIDVQGQILTNGEVGFANENYAEGGGAGGSIWLIANNITGNGSIKANGGGGGHQYDADGGGGGGGRIHIQARNLSLSGNISNLGGASGGGTATAGQNGTIIIEFTENINVASATFASPFNIARNNSYGRIIYNLENNATNQTTNRSIDFQNLIKINNNNITVYSNNNTDLNKSASIWLNGIVSESNSDSSMVLWMHMNNDSTYGENDTRVYDFSGMGNNGTVSGATWTSAGKVGRGAFSFDGINDYIGLGDKAGFNIKNYTWSMWVKSPAAPVGGGVTTSLPIVNGQQRQFYFSWNHDTAGQQQGVGHNDGAWKYATIASTLLPNTWYHVVGTYNGTHILVYVNGNLEDTQAAGAPIDYVGNLSVGSGASANYFNGTIDEVRVYNRSLSASEIQQLYYMTNPIIMKNNGFCADCERNSYDNSTGNLWFNVTAFTEYYAQENVAPVVTIQYPTSNYHLSAVIEFNASVSDTDTVTTCLYSLDGAENVTMTKFNATFFNYTYSGIAHGSHNLTISCNDTLNNFGYASLNNFNVTLLDLTVASVNFPGTVYSNSTLITINISNTNVPNATNVNVSCYNSTGIFDSKLISQIDGNNSYITNCTYTFTSGLNYLINVTVDPNNTIPESNETNNFYLAYTNVSQLGDLDAYDLEDDAEDKTGWFAQEQETLPNSMTWFFANYTMSNSSGIITDAVCNIRFAGGNESGREIVPDSSSVLLFHMNNDSAYGENDTRVYDFSPGKNNGSVYGAVWNSTGKIRGGFSFDGINDYIEANTVLVSGYPFTFAAWFKAKTTENTAVISITDKDNTYPQYSLEIKDGNFSLRARENATVYWTYGNAVSANTWQHISGVFFNDTHRLLYVNGVNVANGTDNVSYNVSVDRYSVGRQGDSTPDGYFNGTIDEVAIYNRSLNATEILAIYQASPYYNMSYNSTATLYYYNRTFNYTGNYSWNTTCSKQGYELLTSNSDARIRIPIYNQTSLGFNTSLITVNYNELVNLTVNVTNIDRSSSGYNISSVWANITRPNETINKVYLSGNKAGGIWNASYNTSGQLGNYNITYFANLTNSFDIIKLVTSNFSVQNTSIDITTGNSANTTDDINISVRIRRYNGSDFQDIANNLFVIKLNNVVVSSDILNHSDFLSGTGADVNISNVVQLNLTTEGSITSYTDDFTTTKYATDSINYSNAGYHAYEAVLFELNEMPSAVGNITYLFNSSTKFYNASAYITTQDSPSDPGGNTSIYYSWDNSTWTILGSSIAGNSVIGGNIPVNGKKVFYVMIKSDTTGVKENPVTSLEINRTSYEYSSSGNYTSAAINLPNVTYTVLKWNQELNDGEIKIQLRESQDNIAWDAWSNNYTNNLDNDISTFTKPYLQYRVYLSASNLSRTPVLQDVQILFFNASTNSTGGYNYNITVPTNYLGILPLQVSVLQNPVTGILGSNTTNLIVWARTNVPYVVVKNYSLESNYSVNVNFTRSDIGSLVNGTINITIYNSSYMLSRQCSGVNNCTASWTIPTNLGYGNYTINITGYNETAYYRNGSDSFDDYLEEKNTTGILYVANKTVTDYHYGSKYYIYWNATINNTGKASMNNIHVSKNSFAPTGAIENVTELTPCNKLYPGYSCNALMLITLKSTASPDSYYITWKANWTDNDGSISGGAGYIYYSDMYVTITGNSTLELSNYSANLTVEHASSSNFSFTANSTGSTDVSIVNISFLEGNITNSSNISSSWISVLSTNPIVSIPAGTGSNIMINVSVPNQTAPGVYTGRINISASVGGEKLVNLTVSVPANGSWYLLQSNFTYNRTYSLNVEGEIANLTLINRGNVNLTMNITYSPYGACYPEPPPRDYTCYPGMFTINNGDGSNPTSILLAKGSNASFIIRYNGWSGEEILDLRVIAGFYNASSSPVNYYYQDSWSIQELPPNITDMWFYLYGVNGSIAEQNSPVTIKVRASDDVALNTSGGTLNISWGGGQTQINLIALETSGEYNLSGADYIVLNYSANYTPATSEAYNVIARVLDKSGKSFVSNTYSFTSYGSTTLTLYENYSSISVSNVNLNTTGRVYTNFSTNNTGMVKAYNPRLTFSKNSSIVIENYTFNNLSANSSASTIIQMNVSPLTSVGNYNVTATLTWTNPNNITDTDSVIFVISVAQNKSMVTAPATIITSLASGTSNSSILQVNNTGNVLLSNMSLSCLSGSLCSGMNLSFNESNFIINLNSSKLVNITLTAPAGLAAGSYNGYINISEQNISKLVEIQASVPETKTWTLSPTSVDLMKAVDSSGDLVTITINNTGNVNMTFNLGTTNASLFNPNQSSITVPLGASGNFMVNYSASSVEGSFFAVINVNNTDSGATPTDDSININVTFSGLNVSIISPSQESPLTNVTSGQALTMVVIYLAYGGDVVGNNTTWNITVGNVDCSIINYSYESLYWSVSCYAPDLTNGRAYNLSAIAHHVVYGDREGTQINAIVYRDLTPPWFNITRNNINKGNNINLQVNISDNVNISAVSAILIYPNETTSNLSLTLSSGSNISGIYINNSINLTEPGEYLVNYSANDTTGNFNSSTDWFEVYDKYYWIARLLDYAANPIVDANISLYRANGTILLSNITNSEGKASLYVNKRFYDTKIKILSDELIVRNVNFTNLTTSNISLNMHRMSGAELAEIIPLYKPFIGIVSNASGLDSNWVNAVFNYSGYSYDASGNLGVVKCSSWDYGNRTCSSSWSALTSSINRVTTQVTGNSTGFSAYFLAEDKCGNGLCELTYAETTGTCSDDCKEAGTSITYGGGGGGGGMSSADLARIEELIKNFFNIGGTRVETTSIYKELFAGESTTVRLTLKNTLSTPTKVSLSAQGDIIQFIFFDSSEVTLGAGENRDIIIKIVASKTVEPGNYDGDIIIKSGKDTGKIPTTIRILSPEGKLLDVKIQPLTPTVAPGGTLRLQTDLLNLGKTKKVDVQFDLQLIGIDSGVIVARQEEAFAVETTISTVKEMKIPPETKTGKYMVKATAYYANVEQQMEASSIAYINVQYPLIFRKIFGIPLWIYLLFIAFVIAVTGSFFYGRWLQFRKRRFKVSVEISKLPQPGPNAAFMGKIAETGTRAFLDLNKMQMHTLVAGATGGGKTISAQDVIEEALLHNKSVIVFDPTAQWTGFLRKCDDSSMLKRYEYFNMKTKEARAFNGTIKTIHDPYELINIKEYINRQGEITIFNISHLTPKEIDVVVASTIEQVFKSEPEESKELKTLIVYDEVHRLLPKFGGSGQGFIQLERGVREFRKWGIGLLLISQVLSDFIGEVKANIGTEVQMGTRYEGDLERINMKYGEDILKSVVKEPIGTGMVVNPEFNNGKPYFVSFRPILHSTKRLTNDELVKYEKYFDELEDMEYQISRLKLLNIDVLDLELEIKLAKDKVKSGQFQMADMYFETLKPRIDEEWKKKGRKPEHIIKAKIAKEEVIEGIEIAKKEREKYIKKHPQETLSYIEELQILKKSLNEKKSKGKDTSSLENKIKAIEDKLKTSKEKLGDKDVAGIKEEIEKIKKEGEKI